MRPAAFGPLDDGDPKRERARERERERERARERGKQALKLVAAPMVVYHADRI